MKKMVTTMTMEMAMFVTIYLSPCKSLLSVQQLHSIVDPLAGVVSRPVLVSAVTQLMTQTLHREREDLSLVMW